MFLYAFVVDRLKMKQNGQLCLDFIENNKQRMFPFKNYIKPSALC